MAGEHYKSALEFYSNILTANPEDPETLSCLGISAAGLHEKPLALEAGQKAVELTVYDVIGRSDRKRDLAKIYVSLGEYDKCAKLLEELLDNPSNISMKLLKIDPVWKPVFDRPEFSKILLKYGD